MFYIHFYLPRIILLHKYKKQNKWIKRKLSNLEYSDDGLLWLSDFSVILIWCFVYIKKIWTWTSCTTSEYINIIYVANYKCIVNWGHFWWSFLHSLFFFAGSCAFWLSGMTLFLRNAAMISQGFCKNTLPFWLILKDFPLNCKQPDRNTSLH